MSALRISKFVLIAALAFGAGAARAQQSVANFYRGKQLEVRIGSGPGSGYDLAGRLIAPYLAHYLPGHPTVVVKNEPGAGSLTLTNELYNTAPRDGSVIAVVINGMPTAPLLTPETARFDSAKLNWLGTPSPETDIVMVTRAAPVQTYEDLFKKTLVVGGVAPGTAVSDMPLVTNAVAGTKFKIINGYETTGAIELAMQRGELQGEAAIGWISVKTRDQLQLRSGAFKIVAQYGLEKNPELPNVPLFALPKDKIGRESMRLMVARQEFGRPFVAPRDVPSDRVTALRRAFDQAMADPQFRKDAEKAKLDVHPITGERLQELANQVAATDPAAIKKMRDILDPRRQRK